MKNRKRCYVIMPFSDTKSCTEKEWTEIFEDVVKPAVEESGLGYKCERSRAKRENIIKAIVNDLNTAQAVIADLTDDNPNVFYELGVRHTLQRRTILIAQHEEDIPFDLKPYPTIIYNRSPAGVRQFKQEIKGNFKDMEGNPERADNPVADFLAERNIDLLSSEKKVNLAKLSALVSELSYDIESVDIILDAVKKSEETSKKDKTRFYVSNVRFDNACLELILSTAYIMLPKQLLEVIKKSNDAIRMINSRFDLWGQEAFRKHVEENLKNDLPKIKEGLASLLQEIGKLLVDYQNDNYVEPKAPVILLSSPEHKKYIEESK